MRKWIVLSLMLPVLPLILVAVIRSQAEEN